MIDPRAYRLKFGSWPTPASKHEPLRFGPPYGTPKVPELTLADWPMVLLVLGLLALAGVLRFMRGEA